eukprot:COSAG03_NODE_21527_length_303_cov_0.715686_1_plen_36_part_10
MPSCVLLRSARRPETALLSLLLLALLALLLLALLAL